MKILVFENGQPGRAEIIAGENVKGEVEELLGGEVVSEQLNARLVLMTRKHGENKGLPVHYERLRPWKGNAPIYGNAVVARASRDGKAHSITTEDGEDVNLYLRPAEG